MHRDLRHSRADVVVKDAFISDLRQQLLEIGPLVSQRDQLCEAVWTQATVGKVRAVGSEAPSVGGRTAPVVSTQEALETKLRALQTYVNSAGFRIVENVTRHLRRFPTAFRTTRTNDRSEKLWGEVRPLIERLT